jgi:hypothetical protein
VILDIVCHFLQPARWLPPVRDRHELARGFDSGQYGNSVRSVSGIKSNAELSSYEYDLPSHGGTQCTFLSCIDRTADRVHSLPYAISTCTVCCMYLFLPAPTPILVLITCTQRNTTPYVVVSGVEVISDTFTVLGTFSTSSPHNCYMYVHLNISCILAPYLE